MNAGIKYLIAACLVGWLLGKFIGSEVADAIIFEELDKHGEFLQNMVLIITAIIVALILIMGW